MAEGFGSLRSMSTPDDEGLPPGFVDHTRKAIPLGPVVLMMGIVIVLFSTSLVGVSIGWSRLGDESIGWAEAFARISRHISGPISLILGILGIFLGPVIVVVGVRRTHRDLKRMR